MSRTPLLPIRLLWPSSQSPRGTKWLLALLAVALAAAIGPAGSPRTAQAVTSDDAMCAQALALLNGERAAAGLRQMVQTPEVVAVAGVRAREMAETGVFSHNSPSGADAYVLLISQGVSFRKMGENIAQSNAAPAAVVSRVHTMLMASAAHRANMLDPAYGQVGIGVARRADTYYFAIVFIDGE